MVTKVSGEDVEDDAMTIGCMTMLMMSGVCGDV